MYSILFKLGNQRFLAGVADSQFYSYAEREAAPEGEALEADITPA